MTPSQRTRMYCPDVQLSLELWTCSLGLPAATPIPRSLALFSFFFSLGLLSICLPPSLLHVPASVTAASLSVQLRSVPRGQDERQEGRAHCLGITCAHHILYTSSCRRTVASPHVPAAWSMPRAAARTPSSALGPHPAGMCRPRAAALTGRWFKYRIAYAR